MSTKTKWSDQDWAALAEDANHGMNGNGAIVESNRRVVESVN